MPSTSWAGWTTSTASRTHSNPTAVRSTTVSGTFLGQPLSGVTDDPDQFKTDLIGQVVHVNFTTSSALDPGGAIQKAIREGIFNHLSSADAFTKVTARDSLNALASSWLMGSVIASGNSELQPYPSPCTLVGVNVANDVLSLDYITPEKTFVYRASGRLAGGACARPFGEHRAHRRPDAGEPVLRPHAGVPEPALRKGRHEPRRRRRPQRGRVQPLRRAEGRIVPLRDGRHDLLSRSAERFRARRGPGRRREHGRLRPGPGRRVRPGDGAPRDGLPRGGQRSHLRLAGARFRHLQPVVLLASGADVPEPLLHAHRKAEHRSLGRLGVQEFESDAARAHGHDLRAPERAEGLLEILRALLRLPAVLRASYLRPGQRRRLRRPEDRLPGARRNPEICLRCRSSTHTSWTIRPAASATSLRRTSATASRSSAPWSRVSSPVRNGSRRCSSSSTTSTAGSTTTSRRSRRSRSLPRCSRPPVCASRASWSRRGSRAAVSSGRTPCTSTTPPS